MPTSEEISQQINKLLSERKVVQDEAYKIRTELDRKNRELKELDKELSNLYQERAGQLRLVA